MHTDDTLAVCLRAWKRAAWASWLGSGSPNGEVIWWIIMTNKLMGWMLIYMIYGEKYTQLDENNILFSKIIYKKLTVSYW